jgi:hypothetical protein
LNLLDPGGTKGTRDTQATGPISRMEMEKGSIGTRDMYAVGSHRSDGPTGIRDTQAIGSHRLVGDGDGPTGTRDT